MLHSNGRSLMVLTSQESPQQLYVFFSFFFFFESLTCQIDIKYFNTPPTVVLPGASLSVEEAAVVDFIVAARDPDLQDTVTLEFPILPTKGTLYFYNEDSFLFEPIFTSTVLQNSSTVRYVVFIYLFIDFCLIKNSPLVNLMELTLSLLKLVTIEIPVLWIFQQ
jgi:hypothetical protein